MSIQNSVPSLHAALVLTFPIDVSKAVLVEQLGQYERYAEYSEFSEIVYSEICSFNSWEIDDLLTALFLKCNVPLIRKLCEKYGGKVWIDITFYRSNNLYPSLVFEGNNMDLIHTLKANISIDPYQIQLDTDHKRMFDC